MSEVRNTIMLDGVWFINDDDNVDSDKDDKWWLTMWWTQMTILVDLAQLFDDNDDSDGGVPLLSFSLGCIDLVLFRFP